MQDTQPVDMGFSCYWTLTAGHTLGWPQPFGAPGTGHLAMGSLNSVKGGVRGIRARASGETTPGQHTQLPHAMGSMPGTPGPSVCGPGTSKVAGSRPSVLARRPLQLHATSLSSGHIGQGHGSGGGSLHQFGLTPAIPAKSSHWASRKNLQATLILPKRVQGPRYKP